MGNNSLAETIPKDAILKLGSLEELQLSNNKMTAYEISFCNVADDFWSDAAGNKFARVENPFRDCPQTLSYFSGIILKVNKNVVPCDDGRCWMKKYNVNKAVIDLGDCPDGREWQYVTQEQICKGTLIF